MKKKTKQNYFTFSGEPWKRLARRDVGIEDIRVNSPVEWTLFQQGQRWKLAREYQGNENKKHLDYFTSTRGKKETIAHLKKHGINAKIL